MRAYNRGCAVDIGTGVHVHHTSGLVCGIVQAALRAETFRGLVGEVTTSSRAYGR